MATENFIIEDIPDAGAKDAALAYLHKNPSAKLYMFEVDGIVFIGRRLPVSKCLSVARKLEKGDDVAGRDMVTLIQSALVHPSYTHYELDGTGVFAAGDVIDIFQEIMRGNKLIKDGDEGTAKNLIGRPAPTSEPMST